MSALGFVGVGLMGAPMAQRLLAAGMDLLVNTRTRTSAEPILAGGASWAGTPAAVADECGIVVSCLLDQVAVEAVYASTDGILARAREGQLFIEHATMDPDCARRMARLAEAKGAVFLDAPVSGGPDGAAAGELVCMIGGDQAQRPAAEAVVRNYASHICWAGDSGSGSVLKLVNQLLVTCHTAAAAEAAQLLRAAGLGLPESLQALSRGWANSRMLERSLPLIHEHRFEPSGSTIAALADAQALIAGLGAAHGLELATFLAARGRFDAAAQAGNAQLDISAV